MESKLANCCKYISQQAKNRLSQVPLSGLPRENSLARISLFQKAICRDIFQAEQERRRSLAGLQRGKQACRSPTFKTHRVILLRHAQYQQANHDNGWFNGFNPRKKQECHV